ncbi:5'-AMP-activated protein kinase beta subunit, interation domain-containing protein [Mycena vulgaris]|nr:5'-AMP-activated protein kinase beta subunit, interation domain-containing protein [Mycena vulgaris]
MPARRISSARIVDRGRSWLHRAHHPPPRSAAIAIPARKTGGTEEGGETGYGQHVREGIARRKAEARRGRSPTRSPTHSRSRARAPNGGPNGGLRAPSPSRSALPLALALALQLDVGLALGLARARAVRARQRARASGVGRTRGAVTGTQRHGNGHHEYRDPSPGEQARERERYEQLYGAGTAREGARLPYTREVVLSTIPLTIGPEALIGGAEGDGEWDAEDAVAAVVDEIVGAPPPPALTAVPITVFLIRAGDEDWMGRRAMERVGSPTGPFTTTIDLPPGTHHFRFIVDGQTVVAPATEIPNAVDDQGFIANYVAVPGPVATAPPSATTSAAASKPVSPTASTGAGAARAAMALRKRRPSQPMHPDGSFWAQSSAGSQEDVRAGLAERIIGAGATGRGAGWTCVIPEALMRAATQEEAYLDAEAAYHQHHAQQHHYAEGGGARGRHIVLNGFVPEPSIPPAPRLPRHLERLILNRPSPGVVIPRVGTGAGAAGSGSSMNAVGGGAPSPALRVTTASGTDVTVPTMSFTAAVQEAHPHLQPPPSATHPQFGAASRAPAAPLSPGMPLIADDPSVLQTPSHAVLYHLCTSSIRDKMIAVGASTRYRQKYLTTVYYKPAVPTQREESEA